MSTPTGLIVYSADTAIAALRAAGIGTSDCRLTRDDSAGWQLLSPRGLLIATVSTSGIVTR